MKVVIIPATYNEKGNIERLIGVMEDEVFPKISNHKMEILVADDNSPDGTGDIVRNLMKKYKNLGISQGEKKGLGAAYIRAMTYAIEKMDADVVGEIDADLSHDPREIPNFLKKIDEGSDFVIGTRYSDGGTMPSNWPIHRKAFSLTANFVVRLITLRFKIHDWTGGYRLIKKEVFLKERDKVKSFQGYHFQVAFLYKSIMDGYKIGEVPIHFADRALGRSKIAPLEYIINLLFYVIKEKIREIVTGTFGKFLVVGGIGFIINAAILRLGVEVFHLSPEASNLAGAAVAIFSNYNLNNLWTFSHNKFNSFSLYLWKMLQFYATSAFGVIAIQTGTIALLDKLLGTAHYFIYFILGTGLLLIWNFTMYSLVIWRKKPSHEK